MGEDADRARRSTGARRNPDSADAILDAAETVLVETSYSGFSIEAVARRARAGKPTIYRWWPGKAALLFDVYQQGKRVDNPDTGNLEDDLVGFLKNLFSHWRETSSGSVFRSLIAEAQSDATVAAVLAEYTKGRHAHTGRMIERQGKRRSGGRRRSDARRRPDRLLRLDASFDQSPRCGRSDRTQCGPLRDKRHRFTGAAGDPAAFKASTHCGIG